MDFDTLLDNSPSRPNYIKEPFEANNGNAVAGVYCNYNFLVLTLSNMVATI